MALLNAFLTRTFDLLLGPFRALHPLVGLAVVSLVTAIAMLLVFKRTSDQARLAEVKRQIHAGIFEIRLFNDDMRAIFRAQLEILRHNLTYLRLSLAPLLWMILPLTLVVAQLQFHYGYAGLAPGQAVLVKAHLRDDAASAQAASGVSPAALGTRASSAALEAPAGIAVQTPAVWIPGTKEVIWRIAPEAAGQFDLTVRVGQESFTKSVRVSGDVVRRSPVRLEPGLLNQLLYPAEAPLPGSAAVTAIDLAYPERSIPVFGWEIHWMIVYFALSMIFAFALRKRFGVTI